ncbi:MAG: succinylglutamate desuccinylase [Halobacteriovoraceae bacterium]|nr:succinylglutamate desuccinylase [Halobacteriovoraceae bacterium]
MFENYLQKLLDENHSFWDQQTKTQTVPTGTLCQKETGILEYTPKNKTILPPLILSCGVHGNETAPIEILSDLLTSLSKEELIPQRPLLLIFAHQRGMKIHKRFVEYNLNRLFNNQHEQTPDYLESPIAKKLEDYVSNFHKEWGKGIHLDLHTAMRPSQIQKFAIGPLHLDIGETFSQEAKELLESLGIQAVVHTNSSGTTFSSFSKIQFDHLSFTLELGKVMPFGQNNREDFLDTYDGLKELISGSSHVKKSQLQEFNVARELLRDAETYEFYIPDDYVNFSTFKEGEIIQKGIDGELMAKEGQCLIFPNKDVPVGQRTGLLLEPLTGNP